MTQLRDLTPNFRHVRLLLAREKSNPVGDPQEGYDLLVPLDGEGRLNAADWKTHQAHCRVRAFSADGGERIGRLRRKPGGAWYFDYDEDNPRDDEPAYRFGDEVFVVGEYVSISHEGEMRTYRVARVEKP